MKIKKKSLLNPKTFNILYSIGASVVILGALFKLLHVTGADTILILGMGTEALIFFVSAFDEPAKEPNWENVYPGIYDQKSLTAEEKEELRERHKNRGGGVEVAGGGTIIIGGGGSIPTGDSPVIAGGSPAGPIGPISPISPIVSAGNSPAQTGESPVLGTPGAALTEEQASAVATATSQYVEQLNAISESLAKMQSSLAGLGDNTSYAQQMETLNRNIQGLNTIYELQLRSLSSQLGTIEEVNRGLNNIRSLYENGTNDSFRIRQESDMLANNLKQLNEVYARMLQAMTVNMNFTPKA